MNIKSKIYKRFENEVFQPQFLGLFINPFFIIRRGLYNNIVKHKKYLNGKMLDFGCGNKPYKNIIKVDEYIGLDIEKSGHNHYNSEIDVFYNGKEIPFKDLHFDSIFASEVFEHVFNMDEVIKELNRVLKNGGHIIITIPFAWPEHEIPYDFARYTSFGISDILEKNGFKIIKSVKTTNFIETIFQLWNAYVLEYIFPRNIYIKRILTPFFIAPVNMLGIVIGYLLPKNYSYYHNNFIVAKKL